MKKSFLYAGVLALFVAFLSVSCGAVQQTNSGSASFSLDVAALRNARAGVNEEKEEFSYTINVILQDKDGRIVAEKDTTVSKNDDDDDTKQTFTFVDLSLGQTLKAVVGVYLSYGESEEPWLVYYGESDDFTIEETPSDVTVKLAKAEGYQSGARVSSVSPPFRELVSEGLQTTVGVRITVEDDYQISVWAWNGWVPTSFYTEKEEGNEVVLSIDIAELRKRGLLRSQNVFVLKVVSKENESDVVSIVTPISLTPLVGLYYDGASINATTSDGPATMQLGWYQNTAEEIAIQFNKTADIYAYAKDGKLLYTVKDVPVAGDSNIQGGGTNHGQSRYIALSLSQKDVANVTASTLYGATTAIVSVPYTYTYENKEYTGTATATVSLKTLLSSLAEDKD